VPAWGSFEGWSALVRYAVVWIGLPDPGQTRLLLQDKADVTAECMNVILVCWESLDPDRRGLTAAEVIYLLYKAPPENPPETHTDLRDALEALLGKPHARTLGNRLRSYRRRVFQGRFIDQAGSEQPSQVSLVSHFQPKPRATKLPPKPPTARRTANWCMIRPPLALRGNHRQRAGWK
jgi:hypothetical protein